MVPYAASEDITSSPANKRLAYDSFDEDSAFLRLRWSRFAARLSSSKLIHFRLILGKMIRRDTV